MSAVLPILAAFSRYPVALDWARAQAESHWGPVALASPRFEFAETEYYRPTMGDALRMQLWAFERQSPAEELVARKLQTGGWEAAYRQEAGHAESRPLNLDPGYLTLAKFVLASTKDHAHRLALGNGIYGEVTLAFQHGGWQPQPWSYPNYRRPDYQQFLTECREYFRDRRRAAPGAEP